jgi:hypothetical protein
VKENMIRRLLGGRELLNGISRSLEGDAARDPTTTADPLEKMTAFGSLQRHHIRIEDHLLDGWPGGR